MRMTIIKDDNAVIIDHDLIEVDLNQFSLPDNFHALQWYEDQGEVEYNDGSFNNEIDSIVPYQDIIDEYNRLKEIRDTPKPEPVPTEEELEEMARAKRNKILSDTDWTIMRHQEQKELGLSTSITDEQYKQTLVFREQLRKMMGETHA